MRSWRGISESRLWNARGVGRDFDIALKTTVLADALPSPADTRCKKGRLLSDYLVRMDDPVVGQDALYRQVVHDYGAALARLARAYEPDRTKAEDLYQEIHLAVWVSLGSFAGRCSLRTWVYRVAHNTAVSLISRRRGRGPAFVSLDELAERPGADAADDGDARLLRARLLALVQTLAPVDRQVIVLYMEDLDAAAIVEIVGLSAANVATKIHRIKKVLAQRFHVRVER